MAAAIGIDTHKATLAACCVDELGTAVSERTFDRPQRPGTRRPPRPGEPPLGYQWIRGELLKLGIRISATTVRRSCCELA